MSAHCLGPKDKVSDFNVVVPYLENFLNTENINDWYLVCWDLVAKDLVTMF